MKKTILLFCAALLGIASAGANTVFQQKADAFTAGETVGNLPMAKAPQSRAEQSMTFSYADGMSTAYGLNGATAGKTTIYLAFEFRKEDVATYVGNSITAVNLRGGSTGMMNNVRDVTYFITSDLNGEPEVKGTGRLGAKPYAEGTFTLDTPYVLDEAKTVYIGYSFAAPSRGYYVPTDNTPATPSNLIYGMSDTESRPAEWYVAGDEIGSLSAGVVITGESLPQLLANITTAAFPSYVRTGETSDIQLTFRNVGLANIESLTVRTTVGDETPADAEITLSSPLAPSVSRAVNVTGIPFNNDGEKTVKVEIVKLNGEEIGRPSSVEGTVMVYSEGYDRTLVVEEGTGTWCGWCPGGIVFLEYVAKTYPDRFLRIAYHNKDEMAGNQQFINNYVTGFPYTITNRLDEYTPTSSYSAIQNFVNRLYDEYTSYPAYCQINIDATEDGENIEFTAAAEFVQPLSVQHYMAFVLVEDNVGPYTQHNYFAGSGKQMDGWENKGSSVSTMFNDVCRAILGFPGINGSLPEKIEKNTVYTYSNKFSKAKLTGSTYRVIGMIVNGNTGEIVNAGQWYPGKEAGVEVVETENNAPAEYYNLQGVRVANPSNGMYIVRKGASVSKVLIH